MPRSTHPAPRSRLAVAGVVACLACPAIRFAAAQSVAPESAALPSVGPQETRPQTAPPLSDAEQEQFLLRAKIVRRRTVPVGVTSPSRATLSDGTLTHDAHIQEIDARVQRFRTPKRTYVNFRDSYKFNIAGYRLDRLLGLNMVPVSVERKVGGKKVAVTWWVDDVLMMDSERYQRGIQPPDLASWNDQIHQARVFNQLIYNADPNLGNFLITSDWRLWMIDFTRAFRPIRQLEEPELLERIDRRLYRGLRALTLEDLRRGTAPYLTPPEIKAVMARRDAILDVLGAQITARGEAAVVCDLPGH